MQLHQLRPNTKRKQGKRIGRGGKRGFTSGKGTKGQKSRAGASVKPGFRGGMKRLWQQYPKKRGAAHKPGNKKPHRKHRYYRLRQVKMPIISIDAFNAFDQDQTVTPKIAFEKGLIPFDSSPAKILGGGDLKKKLKFEGFVFSQSARDKVEKLGGTIK